MEITEPHKDHRQRMRDRFRRDGLSAFEDHEILEMLLFYTVPRHNTNETGHNLLDRFEDFRGVFSATKKDLCTVKGVGETTADFIVFLGEVYREITSEMFDQISLNNDDAAVMYTTLLMKQSPEKSSLVVYLGDNGIRISQEWLELGKDRMSEIMCREIAARAKNLDAGGIILAHDHTKEPNETSPDDSVITETLKREAETVGIKNVRHMIVSDDGYIQV